MSAFPRWWKAILVLAVVALAAGIFWYYRAQQKRLMRETSATLESIAQLKISLIKEWRDSRFNEAATTMASRFYTPLATRWMDISPEINDVESVLKGFRAAKPRYKYRDALFVNPSGKIYFRLSTQTSELHDESKRGLSKAFQTGEAVLTDLYPDPDRKNPQLDLIAPFFINGDRSKPSGAVLFQYDAQEFLYPTIRFWPVTSRSAETLLVRRDGNSVLFLNELRHRTDSPLSFRIPLNTKEAPAVKAALGQRGWIQGIDYRGVPVFSVIQLVPDTSWFLITKIDQEEILSGLRKESGILVGLFLILMASVYSMMHAIWQRTGKEHYRALFEAEAEQRKIEERYRSTLDRITEGCQLIDKEWRYIYLNPIAIKHTLRTKEELLGRTLMELFPDIEHSDAFAAFQRCMKEQVSQHIATKGLNLDGATHWYEISVHPVPEGIFVLTIDITGRKLAEAEHARLISAIDQSGEVVVILDAQRIVRYLNPVFEKVTGFKREDALGKPLPLNDFQKEEFYSQLWSVLESGKSWRGRLSNLNKDGHVYTEDATISPVFDESGKIVNYVSVTRDITDYLKLQEEKEKLQEQFIQVQKMESVGRLAGGVAHDFNNMLSVITGHAQLSLESLNPAHPLYMHLQEINKAALRSADLTRQLLAFARKQTIAPKVLDLNHTVGGLLSMLQRLVGEDIDLAWMPGHNLWPIYIDPSQIDQILANLAVNSRDAIEKHGKISIETENVFIDEIYSAAHPGFMPGEYTLLAFSDDGSGMDKEVLSHLFEPFFTTKHIGKGTGLGLATVYGIVRQNDGFINIYSEPGRGTTFKVYLPRYLGPGAVADTRGEKAELPKGGIETILLVEDESAVLNLARLMLERLGYKVIAASSPTEALCLAGKYAGEIQLLLVDVVMPEMTGRDLSEKLKPFRPGMKQLFMSGYTANVIAHRGVLDEGVQFIQKPFSTKDLAKKIRQVLES